MNMTNTGHIQELSQYDDALVTQDAFSKLFRKVSYFILIFYTNIKHF